MLCEIFSSIISLGTTSNNTGKNGKGLICHGFVAIDPKIFGDAEAIKAHLSAYLEDLRNSPKADGQSRIYTHGEKEVAAVKRILENGVPVNDNTMVEVLDLCNYLGLDFGSYFGDYRPPVKEDVFKGNY
jgi:LDH2 family malate/lactate/ureidoglycolate dehydrogenase